MSSSRLVRGAKTRMFAIVCLICVLGAVVFVFHGTQTKLAEVQKLVNNCNQQQESLSAQLQVIFEYKVRLEKSLSKEKEDHKQTKDTLQGKLNEEKKQREKENQEARNKYDAMVQQNKMLQSKIDDLKDSELQLSKVNEESENLKREIERIKKENKEHLDLLQKKDDDLESLKTQNLQQQDDNKDLLRKVDELKTHLMPESSQKNHLEKENFQLKEELDSIKKELSECEDSKNERRKPKVEIQPDTNVGEMPNKIVYSGQKINGSTTPGLNPEAVNNFELSSTKPVKDMAEVGVIRKPDDQVAQPPKKPTQESVRPLAQPGQLEPADAGIGQIPLPGGNEGLVNIAHDPLGNTLHKPNTGDNPDAQVMDPMVVNGAVQGEPDAAQPKLFVPPPLESRQDEEENFPKQRKEKNAEYKLLEDFLQESMDVP